MIEVDCHLCPGLMYAICEIPQSINDHVVVDAHLIGKFFSRGMNVHWLKCNEADAPLSTPHVEIHLPLGDLTRYVPIPCFHRRHDKPIPEHGVSYARPLKWGWHTLSLLVGHSRKVAILLNQLTTNPI
jgi:hypothetical protein